jgi:glycosyltransferase involved in cell wall biosynthesis
MKVLLLLTSMPGFTGKGFSSFSAKYIEGLVEKGVEVDIVRIRSMHPARRLRRTIQLWNGQEMHELSILLPRNIFGFTFPSFLFRRQMNKLGLVYDVVHAGNGWLAIAASIASKLRSVNYIVQFIGNDANIDLPIMIRNHTYTKAIAGAKMLSFNSQGLHNVFEQAVSPMNVPKSVVRRGVNLREAEYCFELSNEIRIVFLGGVPSGNEKGFFTLLKAINLLNYVKLEKHVKFMIGGPQTLRFRDSIVSLNPKITLEFVGELPHANVIEVLRHSHVVLIPSLQEGIPNLLYESMATGNLVIASNVGGIPEILQDAVSGWLVPPNDEKSLARAIKRVLENDREMEEFATHGRRIVENYGYDRFIDSYLRIYASICGTSTNS